MNESLQSWVVGVVAAGLVSIVAFLGRHAVAGIFKQLDEIRQESAASNSAQVVEIRAIGATVQAQVTAQALADLRIARVESDNAQLRVKLDDLAGFLQGSGFRKRDG